MKKFNLKIRFLKAVLLSAVLMTLCLLVCSCGSETFKGTYYSITSNRSYVFEHDKDNTGSFEMYDDGEKVGDDGKRYENTWELKDDVLIMKRNDSVHGYYKVFDDVLVEVDAEDSEPDMYEYIAPKGKTFDWEYGAYEFYKNGTVYEYSSYSGMSRSGDYYVKDNIIYAKLDYSNPNIYGYKAIYEPLFYIYNDEYIAHASDVLIRQNNNEISEQKKTSSLTGVYENSNGEYSFSLEHKTNSSGGAIWREKYNGDVETYHGTWTEKNNLLEISLEVEPGEYNRMYFQIDDGCLIYLEDTDGYDIPEEQFDEFIQAIISEGYSASDIFYKK